MYNYGKYFFCNIITKKNITAITINVTTCIKNANYFTAVALCGIII